MYRLVFLACFALCEAHAVLPVAPVIHAAPASVLTPYLTHGHGGFGYGHGYLGKHLGHHILRRSPHVVPVAKFDQGVVGGPGFAAGLGHAGRFAVVGPVHHNPVAVSHQARVDVHSSPAVIAPIAPIIGPIYAKPLPHHALGYFGSANAGNY